MAKCWQKVTIGIIIIIILAALILIFAINQIRRNVRKRYGEGLVNYCKNLPETLVKWSVEKPENLEIYNYQLARSLLQASLRVTQSGCFVMRNTVTIPGFDSVQTIVAQNPGDNKKRMFATIFADTINRRILMVFNGTLYLDQWKDDFNFPQVIADKIYNSNYKIRVHRGFYNLYQVIRNELWKTINSLPNIQELYITGHSLGGAISTIAAFDFAKLNPIHYSFASPRVGNPDFANKYNQMLPYGMRINNIEDIITNLPPPIIFNNIYQHVGITVPFDINLGSIGQNHIKAYLDYLPKTSGCE